MEKIDNALKTVDEDVIRIVLVGAFSDGKTSCLAGWLGKKMADMNIDIAESSNEIEIYNPQNLDEQCKIVDTPGLFGTKKDEDTNKKWSDKTIKYISEAHIIFYVVDANDPLKESHSEIASYIIKEKLNFTVFIINKIDDVCDIEDEEDFERLKEIKIENLQGRLEDFFNLSKDTIENIPMVCISSDPYMKKLDYWLKAENIEEYKKKSGIDSLKEAADVILARETKNNLINKTIIIVIAEIINENMQKVEDWIREEQYNYNQFKCEIEKKENDLSENKKELKHQAINLVELFRNIENELLNKLRSFSSYDDVNNFLTDEIGYDRENNKIGYKLTQDISNKINEFTEKTIDISNKFLKDFTKSFENNLNFMKEGLNVGIKGKIGLLKVNEDMVRVARDLLYKNQNVKKSFVDIIFHKRAALREAQKIADISNVANKLIPVLGIGVDFLIESVGIVMDNQQQQKFKKYKDNIQNIISGIFRDVYNQININDEELLFKKFLPHIEETQKTTDDGKDKIKKIRR
nr:LeoA/HP0731 family dynamin-like GTPase [Brachyspira alvinipulli]